MTYQIHLTQFEGPMDLLLHLIRRDKINIYDIPISHITREYLSYIEVMQELKLELAGEFFVMAATLMRIKAQMLLPKRVEEEEEEDPRDELVRNLIEYRKYKEAATRLAEKENERRLLFTRPPASPPEGIELEAGDDMEVSVFDLVDAFRKIMEDLKKQVAYRVEREAYTVEEKASLIREYLDKRSEILFSELFTAAYDRIEIIVTFLALLEMVKTAELVARQMTSDGNIWLYRPGGSPRITKEKKADGVPTQR